MKRKNKFIPALNRHWLTPFFDSFMKFFMREKQLLREVIDHLGPKPGEMILDIGSGTGTLTIMIPCHQPLALVFAIDIDLGILKLAQEKVNRSGNSRIEWIVGSSTEVPFKSHSFDKVTSSFMFHHLDLESKKSTSKNIHRILKPGGKFFLVDFGKPHNLIMWMISMVMKNFEHTRENFKGLIPEFLLNEGFSSFKEIERKGSVFGSISFLEASY